jgi:hypothetical protein
MTMSMKITPVRTHWTAEEAHTVIEFLDVLRDQLWHCYGDSVLDMLRQASANNAQHEDQVTFEFDDDIDF